jgi:hypothetical protein
MRHDRPGIIRASFLSPAYAGEDVSAECVRVHALRCLDMRYCGTAFGFGFIGLAFFFLPFFLFEGERCIRAFVGAVDGRFVWHAGCEGGLVMLGCWWGRGEWLRDR